MLDGYSSQTNAFEAAGVPTEDAGGPPTGPLDCRKAPYNLRPMIEAIMGAENWIMDRLPQGQKLVVLIGEQHTMQDHSLLLHGLVHRHHEQSHSQPTRSFALGMELPHNFPENIAPAPSLVSRIFGRKSQTPDPHGTQKMSAFIDAHAFGPCIEASKRLFGYCLRERISVGFNDVSSFAVQGGHLIDQKDPFTRSMVRAHHAPFQGLPVYRSPNHTTFKYGLSVSNAGIIEKARAHMSATDADVYIQHCGRLHVFGCEEQSLSFQDSLSARFMERGFAVLPVMLSGEDGHLQPPANTLPYGHISINSMPRITEKTMDFHLIRAKMARSSAMDL